MKKEYFKNIKIIKSQQGMALIATLIFVTVLVSFGVALLSMTGDDSKLSTLQRESTRAFYIAETGIEEAMWFLNFSDDNSDGLNFQGDLHQGDANEYYDVVILETDLGPPETKTIRSTGTVTGEGKYDKGSRTIEVKLMKGIAKAPDLFFDYAILTNGNMTIDGGVSFHGNLHSNGNLTNNGTITLEYGTATATGTTNDPDLCTDGQPYQEFPRIAWDYYEDISKTQITDDDGNIHNNYYSGDVTFDSSGTLYGIHFIDGDVTIKPPCSELYIKDGAIFATGTIEVSGSSNVYIEKSESYDNPLALVAKENITIGGNVHGEGIIYTESDFTLNGNINIQKGAIYADDGVFHGGGGSMNVYYDTDLIHTVVPGTGMPVWKKVSWREIY